MAGTRGFLVALVEGAGESVQALAGLLIQELRERGWEAVGPCVGWPGGGVDPGWRVLEIREEGYAGTDPPTTAPREVERILVPVGLPPDQLLWVVMDDLAARGIAVACGDACGSEDEAALRRRLATLGYLAP